MAKTSQQAIPGAWRNRLHREHDSICTMARTGRRGELRRQRAEPSRDVAKKSSSPDERFAGIFHTRKDEGPIGTRRLYSSTSTSTSWRAFVSR